MKIFNRDNGIDKVYVQVSDFTTFQKVDKPIPAGIYLKAMNYKFQSNDDKYNFIEYTKPEEIEFFRNFEYIVDYKEVKDKTITELQRLAKVANDEANEIADLWNELTPEEKKLNPNFIKKYTLLHHKIQDYAFVLWNKQRHIKLNMPLVPDSDAHFIVEDNNNAEPLLCQASIEPNTLLVYKENGHTISEDEINNFALLGGAIEWQADINKNDNEYFRNYHITKKLSEDKKLYIIEFVQPEYTEDLVKKPHDNTKVYNKNLN